MALPGLSLPGLGLNSTLATSSLGLNPASTTHATRSEELPPRTEWRFEVAFSQQYIVKVESGHAELFGVELAPKQNYVFSGCKGALFTWQGCQLELSGEAESEYAGQETEYAVEWLNAHGMLETMRGQSQADGPRVLVVGPDAVGKSSLVRSLASWAVRSARTPTVLNLDPREGLLAPPGSLTAVAVDSNMDVENGYGIAPMSGHTVSSVRTPLIYHFPFASPGERPDVYKAVITRMALSVMSKLEDDTAVRRSGILIDTPGTLNDPKTNYDLIAHIVSEFNINLILTMGSDRLSSDLNRRFSSSNGSGPSRPTEEVVTVLRIAKPGGAVERDAAFMKQLRTQQTRQYFFGSPAKESLNPHSHSLAFSELNLFRVRSSGSASSGAAADAAQTGFAPGADSDEDDGNNDYDIPYAGARRPGDSSSGGGGGGGGGSGTAIFERITASTAMTGSLVAIKFCAGSSDEAAVRDSAVMGYLYVADVDEARKKVRFLAPHPQRWGERALVWGQGWPEAVGDLVA